MVTHFRGNGNGLMVPDSMHLAQRRWPLVIISTQRDYINCHHGVIKSPVQRYIYIRVSVVSFIIVYSTRDTEDNLISE